MGTPGPCRLPRLLGFASLFVLPFGLFPCGLVARAAELASHAAGSSSPGAHPIVMSFERFARDAVPAPRRLSEPEAGRLLIGELGCTACHAGPAWLAAQRAPDLSGAGDRLRSDWMRRFLDEPSATSPGTTMPHVLTGIDHDDRASVVTALVAHLATLRKPVPLPKPGGLNPMPPDFHELGDASRGRRLYHRIGCVACHEPLGPAAASAAPDPFAGLDPEDLLEAGIPLPEPPFPSAPLSGLAAKYSRKSLTEFLLVPLHARPSGRMPDLRLKAAEAADLAAALLAARAAQPSPTLSPESIPTDGATLADRGRELFARHRCGACHLPEAVADAPAAPLPDLASVDPEAPGGCLAQPPPGNGGRSSSAPWYPLDGAQRRAVVAAIDALRSAKPTDDAAPSPDQRSGESSNGLELTLLRLGCLSCHERDGRGGVGTDRRAFFDTVDLVDLGDEGRLPPRLTGVGARLRRDWLAKAVAGTVALRPFMHARMPQFPKEAISGLAERFAAADRPVAVDQGPRPPRDGRAGTTQADRILAGAQLLDLGCIQCHPLGSHALPGTVGVSLEGVTRRVEPDWFRRLLHDPMAVRPGTKMPAFFGPSINRSILDGDADAQIASIWDYLDRDRLEPLPSRLASASGDFELVPREEPIVFRTFMQRAGTHAIAVGFPQAVHLALDAERCRLAEAWRGRFLDARGTWVLAKTAPPADPLGTDRVMIDLTAPLARLPDPSGASWPASADDPVFLGYSLDGDGVPTFRYRLGEAIVRERFLPDNPPGSQAGPESPPGPPRGLVRQVMLAAATAEPADGGQIPGGSVWLCVLAGDAVEVKGPTARRLGASPSLTATLSRSFASLAVEREATADGVKRAWTVPLPADGSTVEVRYRW
jgi:mono/diheme cytochrome c family protein